MTRHYNPIFQPSNRAYSMIGFTRVLLQMAAATTKETIFPSKSTQTTPTIDPPATKQEKPTKTSEETTPAQPKCKR